MRTKAKPHRLNTQTETLSYTLYFEFLPYMHCQTGLQQYLVVRATAPALPLEKAILPK